MGQYFRKNRTFLITVAVLVILYILAIRGMETKDWVITTLRGFSLGAIIFLVAAGFSLIFGLMDVLNLAHGTLFMLGAYVGWTIVVRPDTAVDAVTPVALVLAGFALLPVFDALFERLVLPERVARWWPWVGILLGVLVFGPSLMNYPITTWDVGSYEISPINYAYAASQGSLVVPEPEVYESISPAFGLAGILFGTLLATASLAGFATYRLYKRTGVRGDGNKPVPIWPLVAALSAVVIGVLFFVLNNQISTFLFGLRDVWLFFLALVVSSIFVGALGGLMEITLIRPLYATPINNLLMTLGVSAIGIEVVRAVWGNPEFTMPRPDIFSGSGEGCPAESLNALIQNNCSTISILGGRVRTYNEVFIPIVGIIILIAVWLLLQRTRLGMIIRAGVQDSEMVEALGTNVRQIFTLVFALGVGLAALGGVVAAPSIGLSTAMGDAFLINALIALAIGGLTSYPGAAVGSLIVGMLQQFIIKYGQIGISLPFLDEPFKPTPPLVPASTVLLLVIILLVMPNGLLGRKE